MTDPLQFLALTGHHVPSAKIPSVWQGLEEEVCNKYSKPKHKKVEWKADIPKDPDTTVT